jgi:hypothetical protein
MLICAFFLSSHHKQSGAFERAERTASAFGFMDAPGRRSFTLARRRRSLVFAARALASHNGGENTSDPTATHRAAASSPIDAASALPGRVNEMVAPRKGKRPPSALAVLLCCKASHSGEAKRVCVSRSGIRQARAPRGVEADDRSGVAPAP